MKKAVRRKIDTYGRVNLPKPYVHNLDASIVELRLCKEGLLLGETKKDSRIKVTIDKEKCRIKLPTEILQILGFPSCMDISYTQTLNQLLLSPIALVCERCGNTVNVKKVYGGKLVCKACLDEFFNIRS